MSMSFFFLLCRKLESTWGITLTAARVWQLTEPKPRWLLRGWHLTEPELHWLQWEAGIWLNQNHIACNERLESDWTRAALAVMRGWHLTEPEPHWLQWEAGIWQNQSLTEQGLLTCCTRKNTGAGTRAAADGVREELQRAEYRQSCLVWLGSMCGCRG